MNPAAKKYEQSRTNVAGTGRLLCLAYMIMLYIQISSIRSSQYSSVKYNTEIQHKTTKRFTKPTTCTICS